MRFVFTFFSVDTGLNSLFHQLFTIGNGSSGAAPPPPPATTAETTTTAATTTAAAPPAATTAAGVTLDAAAVAEAQVRDDTATRAFSDAALKTSDGQCLTVSATSGDFRENLIPVTIAACDGSAGQKFDVITAGKHNDQPGTALFVSTLVRAAPFYLFMLLTACADSRMPQLRSSPCTRQPSAPLLVRGSRGRRCLSPHVCCVLTR